MPPEEHKTPVVNALTLQNANYIRDSIVQALLGGAAADDIAGEVNRNLAIAEENDDATMASFFRAVAAVLSGGEGEDAPAFLREHVEVIRATVQMPPKERQAQLAAAQTQAVGANVRDGVVQAIEAGADLNPIADRLQDNLKIAEEKKDGPIASFFRAVLAVLNGDEPTKVASIFQEYVDAVHEAVKARQQLSPEEVEAAAARHVQEMVEQVRDAAFMVLISDGDPQPLIEQVDKAREAVDNEKNAGVVSFLRGVVALLQGEAAEDVPAALDEHLEVLRAVQRMTPEDRKARLAILQARTVAAQNTESVLEVVRQGADRAPVLAALNKNVQIAEENGDAPMMSFFRSVLAVLNGDEPEDVPEFLQEYVDAVREAVREG